jgi:hypothetical protein
VRAIPAGKPILLEAILEVLLPLFETRSVSAIEADQDRLDEPLRSEPSFGVFGPSALAAIDPT